jgi:hypothetical protein
MAGGGMTAPYFVMPARDSRLTGFHAVDVGTTVRPGRVRNPTNPHPHKTPKKPADSVRKKSPPARKTPSRGRYVDEYARPAY